MTFLPLSTLSFSHSLAYLLEHSFLGQHLTQDCSQDRVCICLFAAWVQFVQDAYGLVKSQTLCPVTISQTQFSTFLSDGLLQGLYTICRVHYGNIFAKLQDPRSCARKGHPHCFLEEGISIPPLETGGNEGVEGSCHISLMLPGGRS